MINKSNAILRERREKLTKSATAHKEKLMETANTGLLYRALLDHAGWRHLSSAYLEAHLSPESLMDYLYAEEGKMREEMVKMQALWELMAFIQGQIKNGVKANDELRKLQVRDLE